MRTIQRVLMAGWLGMTSTAMVGQPVPKWVNEYTSPVSFRQTSAKTMRILADGTILVVGRAGLGTVSLHYSPEGMLSSVRPLDDPSGGPTLIDSFGSIYRIGDGSLELAATNLVTEKWDGITGARMWSDPFVYGDTSHRTIPGSAALDPFGNVFIAASSGSDLVVVRLDGVSGHPLWVTRYSAPGALQTGVSGSDTVAIGPGGDVYVAGVICGNGYTFNWLVQRFDGKTGAPVWSAPAVFSPSPSGGFPRSIAVDSRGEAFVWGSDETGEDVILKVDGATGGRLWVTHSSSSGGMSVDAQGDLILVTTEVFHVAPPNGRVTKLDGQSGHVLWSVLVVEGRRAANFALDDSGDVFVASSTGIYGTTAIARVKGTTGEIAWRSDLGPPPTFETLYPVSMTLDDDGNPLVAETRFESGEVVATLTRYDRNDGHRILGPVVSSVDGRWETDPWALDVDPSGNVFVMGKVEPGISVSKLDGAQGTSLWPSNVVLSRPAAYPDPSAVMASSPTGDLFVFQGNIGVLKLEGTTGGIAWQKKPPNLPSLASGHSLVAVDSSGDVFLSYDDAGSPFSAVTKLDGATGNVLWKASFVGGTFTESEAVALDDAGDVFVVGRVHLADATLAVGVAKWDGRTGEAAWTDATAYRRSFYTVGWSGLSVDAKGDVVVATTDYISGRSRLITLKLDGDDGSPLWPSNTTYEFGDGEDVSDLKLGTSSSSGDAFITGSTSSFGAKILSTFTIKYSATTGASPWPHPIVFQPAPSGFARAAGMKVLPNGNVIVTATAETQWPQNAMTYEIDGATSNIVWGPVTYPGVRAYGLGLIGNDPVVGARDSHGLLTIRYTSAFGFETPSDGLPVGYCGRPYDAAIVTRNGADGVIVQLMSGALPSGLRLNEAGDRLSGTPTQLGSFAFHLSGQSPTSGTIERDFTVEVLEGGAWVAVAATPVPACPSGPVTLSVAGSFAGYSWIPTGETTPTIQVTPSHTTTYAVVVTEPGGCTRRGSVVVNVRDLDVPQVAAPPSATVVQSTCAP